MDPKIMMEAYPHVNKAFGKKEKKWKENIQNDSNYMPGFQLKKDYNDDEAFQDYNYNRGKNGYGYK